VELLMLVTDNVPAFVRGDFVVNRRDIVVEWGHCDPAGIVFHPRFLEYFDWSCVALLEAATGASQTGLNALYGLAGIPIVDMEAKFLKRVTYDDHVQVFTAMAAIGRASFKIRHCLVKNGEAAVECQQTRVWCRLDPADNKSPKAHPIPEPVIAALRLK
jgi:4-hydroxybenzoyl-CoA thioesterase